MTEHTDPVVTGVQVPPGVDAGETVSEPSPPMSSSDPEPDSAPSSEGVDSPRSRSTARRSRRGGRGRRDARTRTNVGAAATGGDATGSATEARVQEAARADDGEPSEAADADLVSTETPAAGASTRRRRRRGGRGRGGRARTPGPTAGGASEPGGAESAGEATSDVEPPEPEPRPEVAVVEAIDDEDVAEAAEDAAASTAGGTSARRRRRRGGRGRGRGRSSSATTAAQAQSEAASETDSRTAAAETEAPTKPARARSRRRAAAATGEEAAGTDAAAAVAQKPPTRTRTRRSRTTPAGDEATRDTAAVATAGPTRLRRGRSTAAGTRRRREPMVVVPRVTDKLMAITEHGDRDQIAILEERTLVQHYVTRAGAKSMVGNVYLGRVQNVLPGMEAAFVDIGRGRNAVLYAGEVNYSPDDLEGKQPPRIEQVLKSGQSVLVQVTKDPIGGKGARLTAKISMPGRYLVLQPNWEITGISKRLEDSERRRLRSLMKKIRPEGHGLIVRTAAEEASEEDLRADVDRLLAEWGAIEKKAKKAKAPAVLYEEPELTVKVVRDLFTDEEYRELVTDSERVYTLVTEYLAGVAPDLLPKVRLHTGKLPAFEEFHVVEQIHKGLDRKVWLPAGGYLVIDRTEAMTVIDVNTGKSVGKTNLEETVVNTNIEAAREVARQLRLRDIGGMIIIDFIDMLLEQNKRRVVDTLKEEMARDKTRSQVFDISPLGLLEVTRKRVSGGLLESFSETCPTCEGRGVILTYET
jgi:ribonuclease E